MKIDKNKLLYLTAMVIYGTTGIIKHFIPYSAGLVSFFRAIIGAIFLYALIRFSGRRPDLKAIRANLWRLIAVGVLLGFNWIAFFESCNNTTVAKASLCYYMTPVFFILLTPVFFKEKLTLKKIICTVIAITGMVLVSGVLTEKGAGVEDAKGLLLGLLAAVLYTAFLIVARGIGEMEPTDRTFFELTVAAITLLPYWLFTDKVSEIRLETVPVLLVLLIGVMNTGVAYAFYFGTMGKLSTQAVAIFSYADPAVSVLLSALLLREPLGLWGAIGAVLVLGSMIICDLEFKKEGVAEEPAAEEPLSAPAETADRMPDDAAKEAEVLPAEVKDFEEKRTE